MFLCLLEMASCFCQTCIKPKVPFLQVSSRIVHSCLVLTFRIMIELCQCQPVSATFNVFTSGLFGVRLSPLPITSQLWSILPSRTLLHKHYILSCTCVVISSLSLLKTLSDSKACHIAVFILFCAELYCHWGCITHRERTISFACTVFR